MSLDYMPHVGYSHEDRGGWAKTVAKTHFLSAIKCVLQGDFGYLIRQ